MQITETNLHGERSTRATGGKNTFFTCKTRNVAIVRPNKVPGQQYHLTQLLFDVEIDEGTGFALVYNILFHFEKPATCYTGEDIIALTRERLDITKIEVENIIQPIAPLCSSRGNTAWNGMIKAHLKNSMTHGVALLEGWRIFMLTLDGVSTVAKVAKGSTIWLQGINYLQRL